jgi:hypothetical protein
MSVQNDANRLTELKLQSVLPEQLKKLGEKWGWILGIGVAYTIVGIIAFMLPLNTTVGLTGSNRRWCTPAYSLLPTPKTCWRRLANIASGHRTRRRICNFTIS